MRSLSLFWPEDRATFPHSSSCVKHSHPNSAFSHQIFSIFPPPTPTERWRRLYFRQVSLRKHPGGCSRYRPRRSGPFAAQPTAAMAGRQSGWSQAALFQFLLGICLTVMPPTQARSLRFVTLVMGDGVTNGFAKAERAKAGW